MEYAVGFLIAVAIGLTGVGAGIITAPVLMLVFGLPPAVAVGTALAFGAVTKLLIVPIYALRRQIAWRPLAVMLAGGLPGVVLGGLVLGRLDVAHHQDTISLLLGLTIVAFSLLSLVRVVRPPKTTRRAERLWLLGAVALPIGAEVGVSSAGSGSLASLAIMAFTKLETAAVVGTDVSFGLGISLVGGGLLFFSGHYDPQVLPKILAGGVVGALIAPNLNAVIPARPLRVGLLLWIIALGGQLVSRGFAR